MCTYLAITCKIIIKSIKCVTENHKNTYQVHKIHASIELGSLEDSQSQVRSSVKFEVGFATIQFIQKLKNPIHTAKSRKKEKHMSL